MSDKEIWQELSAYLDGEAADSEGIARLLESHPEYARQFDALRRLSHQVKSLAPPEVHPGFLTRVMAEVAETRPARASWLVRFGAPLATAGAAVIVVLVGAVVLRAVFAPEAPVELAGNGGAVTAEEALFEALEARAAAGGDIDAWAEASFFDFDDATDVSTEDLITGLAAEDWFDELVLAWEADEDLDTIIGALNDYERATFNELLQSYREEGMTI